MAYRIICYENELNQKSLKKQLSNLGVKNIFKENTLMNELTVASAMEEIQYRLSNLIKMIPNLEGKRIVIYGAGINAKRVLDCMNSLDILGLMDENYTGKYLYGKRVLSENEVQLLKVDVILIAAEPQSTEIVYKRIMPFCLKNNITILNMYGLDEMNMHQNVLVQNLEYPKLSQESIENNIDSKEVLLVSFKNVLCSEIISNKEKLYEKIEAQLKVEGICVANFKRNRILAQKRVSNSANVTLKAIYNVLSTMLTVDEKTLGRIKAIEEQIVNDNLIPRIEVVNLLKNAILKGKNVYIYSDTVDGERVIEFFMKKSDIVQYKTILGNSVSLPGVLTRTMRALVEHYGYDKILCFGNDISDNLIYPQLYNISFQVIQSSYQMFFSNTALQVDDEYIEKHEERNEIVTEILQAYNSPFLEQIDCTTYDNSLAQKIGWQSEEGKMDVEIEPLVQWNSLGEIEKIAFPIEEQPMVSIVIPAYNQFEYTYNCLKSILSNTDNVSYEVIVADDNSSDFTSCIGEVVSGITVIHNEKNLVFIKNCNNAAKIARGKYLLFLNNDTEVQLNWLHPLVNCMEQDESVGLVGSKLIYPDGTLQEAGGIMWSNANAWNYGRGKNPNSPDFNYIREVDYISGAAIMLSKELWDNIGGFDERYLPAYYEDADLAFEVRKRGKKVLYQPDSVVVHFEGVSNGKNVRNGIKKYQVDNQHRFREKWKSELVTQQYSEGERLLAACERKGKRKTVLFVSENVPTYDRDAGSRTIDFYIQEFIKRGYIVKYIPDNFIAEEPYTHRLQQMGVEVFIGKHYQKTIFNWIGENYADIDFAFLNYPNAASKYIDVLKNNGIPVMYYGMDLHYIRLQREYKISGSEQKLKEAKEFYEKEAYLIKNSDVVYYPSVVETEIVRNDFQQENVKQLMINIYDIDKIMNSYNPEEREGIMFVGGYRHAPNVDAVKWFSYHVFPKIYERLEIPFYIVGVDMPVDIRNIDVEGTVKLGALTDGELEEMYNKVKMIVAPLRYGAGTKGKVIEAMYQGIPVLTTTIGIEGIPNEDGTAKIADTEEDFANAVVEMYGASDELKRMSLQGQDLIRRYYSREAAWNNISEDFQ